MIKLSIMIPTHGREEKFLKLIENLSKHYSTDERVQIVAAVQDAYPNLDVNQWPAVEFVFAHVSEGREKNYLNGLRLCKGETTLILEDDDIPVLTVIDDYLEYMIYPSCTVYNTVTNFEMTGITDDWPSIPCDHLYKNKNEFIAEFPDLFQGRFQWGQVITDTKCLLEAAEEFWSVKENHNLVQADEIITMLAVKKSNKVIHFHGYPRTPLIFVGVNNDNFSWGNPLEAQQVDRYIELLRKYISDDEKFLTLMRLYARKS